MSAPHSPSSAEIDDLTLRVAVAIASRRDAFRAGEKLAQSYLDDARVAIAVMETADGTSAVSLIEASDAALRHEVIRRGLI